jgi:hypothetical protein
MSAEFIREFKIEAAKRDLKLNELLKDGIAVAPLSRAKPYSTVVCAHFRTPQILKGPLMKNFVNMKLASAWTGTGQRRVPLRSADDIARDRTCARRRFHRDTVTALATPYRGSISFYRAARKYDARSRNRSRAQPDRVFRHVDRRGDLLDHRHPTR